MRSEKLALVGRLAATIAHEINNPLAAVTNLLYVIDQSVSDKSTRGYVKLAMEEVDRVSRIVTETLRFNRGSDVRSWERVSQIVDSALALYEVRLRQSGIALIRDYKEGDRLFCLPSGLRQVFANLIANAIDAMQRDGKLMVRIRSQSDVRTGEAGLRVSIADTGHGMDREMLRRLFQPFVSTKGEQGTGLGLWVSREILDRHKANLRVRSRQKAGASGTVFSIWIPQTKAENSSNALPVVRND